MSLNILSISASNVEGAREFSASTRTCNLIRSRVLERQPTAEVKILTLIDHEIRPCRMCGKCLETGHCSLDSAFNQVYEEMVRADAIFLVCPHYAFIPSKVVILLEKMQEMAYLGYCVNPDYRFTLYKKPVGIIAHGGQGSEALPYYQKMLLAPLAYAFASVQAKITGAGEQSPNGVVFGVTGISQRKDSIFVDISYDWDGIRDNLEPLIMSVLDNIGGRL
jgi:hypothetical protein